MYRKEVNEHSPMRLFEDSTHGGLGPGNVGMVISDVGVGKTAFLVGLALDDLMRGRNVLHVSDGHSAEHVRDYYAEIFNELASATHLENRGSVKQNIEKHRMIHCFCNNCFEIPKLREGVQFDKEHLDFMPEAVVLDWMPDADKMSLGNVNEIKDLAREINAEIWLTATCAKKEMTSTDTIPASIGPLEDRLDVIVGLYPAQDHIQLRLLKDHNNKTVSDLCIDLDPKTLLLTASPA